ncbi:hypothetical protein [Arsenophonus apicola]|nr:hypothetical protein [Arsenophonus apicola]
MSSVLSDKHLNLLIKAIHQNTSPKKANNDKSNANLPAIIFA